MDEYLPDVLPALSPTNIGHGALRHFKQRRYLPLSPFRAADLADLLVRQPSVPPGRPAGDGIGIAPRPVSVPSRESFGVKSRSIPVPRRSAPLRPHVVGVVLRGPEEKMSIPRPTARRVVATMQHPEPFRYWPDEQGPRYAVGAGPQKLSVSGRVSPSRPDPAIAGSVEHPEEARDQARFSVGKRGRIAISHGSLLAQVLGSGSGGRSTRLRGRFAFYAPVERRD